MAVLMPGDELVVEGEGVFGVGAGHVDVEAVSVRGVARSVRARSWVESAPMAALARSLSRIDWAAARRSSELVPLKISSTRKSDGRGIRLAVDEWRRGVRPRRGTWSGPRRASR